MQSAPLPVYISLPQLANSGQIGRIGTYLQSTLADVTGRERFADKMVQSIEAARSFSAWMASMRSRHERARM